jgi:citrate synthase
MPRLLTAAEAAGRLGVKPATLYAYVSRGTLRRQRAADGRTSLFDADEVERLARRGRPRRPANAVDITVESQLTEITADRLRYRGLDAAELARTRTFEDVAELLWTGSLTPADRGTSGGGAAREAAWEASPDALEVGRAVHSVLPDRTLPLERLQVIVPAMATTDPLRLHLDRPAVIAAGRTIIAGMVDCLPEAGEPPGPGARVADRLWTRLCNRRPSRAMLHALSAALILLADHELAASTLAARTAASARADPYAVVATGLGAVSGALHGGASLAAEAMLNAAGDPADVPRVVADLLRRGEKVPGFGHVVYKSGDPRAAVVTELIREAAPRSPYLAIADAVAAEVARKSLPGPNIDFAVATLARSGGMVRGAGEAIFAVARTAGWLAHALEAYESGTMLRPRASYTGPAAPLS